MTMRPCFFNDAIVRAAEIMVRHQPAIKGRSILIRDIYGRVRIAIDELKETNTSLVVIISNEMEQSLGAFNGGIIFKDDLFGSDAIFKSDDVVDMFVHPDPEKPIRVLDRQIVGQDWLHTAKSTDGKHPPRFVFYGIKGGVGRSTALTMAAHRLARKGKKVLLIDFDLESPGLSSLLLPPTKLADFGLVDWFVEDAVGQGSEVIHRMVSESPLAANAEGRIRIAAAMGNAETNYLAKLSRVYADIAHDEKLETFAQRMQRLVETLEQRENPDVVLIDSRGGLHDLAAISIVGLSNYTFMFAVNTAQSWEGYRLLFSHWQAYPAILKKIRDRLVLVHALFPESGQLKNTGMFLEKAYSLFSDTMYEEIAPSDTVSDDTYNFDMRDQSAPHYPLRIKWNNRFQEFDMEVLEKGILTEVDIDVSYGDFLNGVEQRLPEEH